MMNSMYYLKDDYCHRIEPSVELVIIYEANILTDPFYFPKYNI
jgi:hypothetical protein